MPELKNKHSEIQSNPYASITRYDADPLGAGGVGLIGAIPGAALGLGYRVGSW